jgi:hypothetical protein
MTLIHQLASPFACCNGAGFALIGDAGIVERGQEARIRARTIAVRIGLCGCGDRDYGGAACNHHKHSHRFILVQIGAVVLPHRLVGSSTPESNMTLASKPQPISMIRCRARNIAALTCLKQSAAPMMKANWEIEPYCLPSDLPPALRLADGLVERHIKQLFRPRGKLRPRIAALKALLTGSVPS